MFEEEIIECDAVVSTLPVWDVLKVVPEWELPDWYAGQITFLAQPHFKVTWLGLYIATNEPAAILDRKELAHLAARADHAHARVLLRADRLRPVDARRPASTST